jgi:hypothetical protein
MTIPEIREELFEIADCIQESEPEAAAKIRMLAEETKRRPAVRKTPVRSAKFDADMRSKIKERARFLPGASEVELAREFNVNPGRISEALAGVRGQDRDDLLT